MAFHGEANERGRNMKRGRDVVISAHYRAEPGNEVRWVMSFRRSMGHHRLFDIWLSVGWSREQDYRVQAAECRAGEIREIGFEEDDEVTAGGGG